MELLPSVGTTFKDRKEVKAAGLHKHLMAGIDYEKGGNARSIVISGGYKDDQDFGDRIIYTGQGGQSAPGSGKQISDQELTKGNQALVNSHLNGAPVMVIRGAGGNKEFSPSQGYRYDGLYLVTQHWFEKSLDGPLIVRFELEQLANQELLTSDTSVAGVAPLGNTTPGRSMSKSAARIKRDPTVPKWVKATYRDQCQICRTTVSTPSGNYSQGAHIQGLGTPHNGQDVVSNMLCLCPNCHVMFDFGTYYIKEDGHTVVNVLTGAESEIALASDHRLDLEVITHHRVHVAGVVL
jgi:putative restriction endonuclease